MEAAEDRLTDRLGKLEVRGEKGRGGGGGGRGRREGLETDFGSQMTEEAG